MILARVVGEVVSSHKRPQFDGAKLLILQPETPSGATAGASLLAIDSVGAGRGELVSAGLEGRAAQEALGKKLAPVDCATATRSRRACHGAAMARTSKLREVPGAARRRGRRRVHHRASGAVQSLRLLPVARTLEEVQGSKFKVQS